MSDSQFQKLANLKPADSQGASGKWYISLQHVMLISANLQHIKQTHFKDFVPCAWNRYFKTQNPTQ